MEKRVSVSLNILAGIITISAILVALAIYNAPQKPSIHDFEYIMMVDGTDSANKYIIYDNNHNYVGTAPSTQLDSLINSDNL